MNPERHVAVMGFESPGQPCPGASALRALRARAGERLRLTAIGVQSGHGSPWLPGLANLLCRDATDPEDDACLLETIEQVHAKAPIDAIVPATEQAALRLAGIAEGLRGHGIAMLVAGVSEIEALSGSKRTRWLQRCRIPTPLTLQLSNLDDIESCEGALGYPLLVRAPGHLPARSSGIRETRRLARRMLQSRPSVRLQRVVPGDRFEIGVIADRHGRCTAQVTVRWVAQTHDGRGVCAAVVDDPAVAGRARDVVEALHWRGPLIVELVRPAGAQELLLSDLRCQLPVWAMLGHWAEVNLPMALVDETLGDTESGHTRARPGTMSIQGVTETAVEASELTRLHRKGTAAVDTACASATGSSQDQGLRVAVTGTSTFDVINPGLGVARALRVSPEVSRVFGLTYGNFDSGVYAPGLFDACFRLPDSRDPAKLLDSIRQVHRHHHFDVLVPCLDGELASFIQIRDELGRLGIRTLLPTDQAVGRRSKIELARSRSRDVWDGFEIPESEVAHSEKKLHRAVRRIGLPAAIKGPVSECARVDSHDDIADVWRRMKTSGADRVIVQPWIPGPFFAVSAVCDEKHRVLSAVTVKKLVVCPRGSTWSAIRVECPRLEASFARFLEDIGWTGPVEGEFIRDEFRDSYHLIEVNPRFTAWIYFSALLGANQPLIAARAALGEQVVAPDVAERDLVFMRASEESAVRAASVAALSTKGVLIHGEA